MCYLDRYGESKYTVVLVKFYRKNGVLVLEDPGFPLGPTIPMLIEIAKFRIENH